MIRILGFAVISWNHTVDHRFEVAKGHKMGYTDSYRIHRKKAMRGTLSFLELARGLGERTMEVQARKSCRFAGHFLRDFVVERAVDVIFSFAFLVFFVFVGYIE